MGSMLQWSLETSRDFYVEDACIMTSTRQTSLLRCKNNTQHPCNLPGGKKDAVEVQVMVEGSLSNQ